MNRSNRKRPRVGRRNRRRAALLILACVSLVSTLILCGLVIDVGNVNVARTELQRGADAAALAAVATMMEQSDWTAPPNTSVVSYHARNAATEYVALNPCRGVNTMTLPRNDENTPNGDLVLGHYNSTTGVFDPNDTRYNAVRLFLRRDDVQNGPIPLFFGGLVGMRGVNAFARAGAYSETNISGFRPPQGANPNDTSKLLPFSLNVKALDTNRLFPGWIGADDEDPYSVTFEAPGNFGTVNLISPTSTSSGMVGNSANTMIRHIRLGPTGDELLTWGEDGFGLHSVDDNDTWFAMLNGDTGVVAAMASAIEDILDQPRIIMLHEEVTGQGNTAMFKVVCFVGIKITDFRLTGALRQRHITFEPNGVQCDWAVGGGQAGVTANFVYGPMTLWQ